MDKDEEFKFVIEEGYGDKFAPITKVGCSKGNYGMGIYSNGHNLSKIEIENMKRIVLRKVIQAISEERKGLSRQLEDEVNNPKM